MKKKVTYKIISLTLLSPLPLFAMFCPKGFNQINIGDTQDHVITQCGKPDATETSKQKQFQPQEWNYYVQPNPKQPNSLKMSVAFNADKKVVNISVNGTSLVSTSICGKASLKLGDTIDTVTSICGKPAFKNEGTQGNSEEETLTTLTYNTNPPTLLIFQQGKLVGRQ